MMVDFPTLELPTTQIVRPLSTIADFSALTDCAGAEAFEKFEDSVKIGYAGYIWPSWSIQTCSVSGGIFSTY